MKRIARILRRGLAALAVLVVVAIAAAYAFTQTDRFLELARTQLLAALDQSFRGQVALERIEGSVWGDLLLRGLVIRYQGEEIASLPRVVLRYELLPVLRGIVRVTALEAPDAHLVLVEDEHGEWNLLQALSPKAPSSGSAYSPAIELDPVRLQKATLEITPYASPTYFAKDVTLDAAIHVRAAGASADVRSAELRLLREGWPEVRTAAALAYDGESAPPTLSVRTLSLRTDGSTIGLTATVRGFTPAENTAVAAALTVERLSPGDIASFNPGGAPGRDLSGTVTVGGKLSDLDLAIALAAGSGKVEGRARADLSANPPRYDASFDARTIDVAELVPTAGIAGVFSGSVRARGAGADLAQAGGEAKLDARGVAAAGWRLGDVSATAALADRRAKVEGAVTNEEQKRATLDGEADLSGSEQYRLALTLVHFDPKKVAPGRAALAGDLNLAAKVEGRGFSLPQARGQAEVRLSPSTLGGVAFQRGDLEVAVAEGRAKIQQAELRTKGANALVKGDVALEPAGRGRLQYDLTVSDLAPWLALAGRDGAGALGLHGSANGSLQRLDVSGRLQAKGVRLDTNTIEGADASFDVKLIEQQDLRGRLAVKVVNSRGALELRDAAATVEASEKRRFSLDLAVTDTAGRAHHLAATGAYGPSSVTLRLADLTLQAPEGAWRLAHPVAIEAKSERVSIADFALLGSDQRRVTLDGAVGLRGRQVLRLTVDRFSLESLRPFLGGAPEMRGVIQASVDLAGTAAAPTLDGKAAIGGLAIAGQSFEGLTAALRYQGGVATVQVDFRQDASHTLTANGRLPVVARWDPSWSASVAGDANFTLHSSGVSLAPLNAFSGRAIQKINGELSGDVTATGPIDALKPHGSLELRGGEASVAALGTAIRDAAVQVRFDPAAIQIDKLFARAGDGTLEGRGTVPLIPGAPDPLRLSIEAKQFRAASSYRYRADVDAQLSVAGTTVAPELRGRVEVLRALIRPDLAFLGKGPTERDPTIQLVSDDTAPEPPADEAKPAAKPGFYETSSLDLMLAIHRDCWVRQGDTAVELEGEVHATKAPHQELSLAGEVNTVRGWAVLQGHRFTVARGRVQLTGGPAIDPTLDVVADYKKGSYVVHAIVSGTASKPALTLESEPPLEQADIVSVLVFGKPASELNDGQKADLGKQATQLAAGFAFTEIGQSVTRALGLEEHGIQIEELSTERVALGSNVTSDTYVTLGQNIGDRKGQEVSLEHEIIRNWSIQTSTSSAGGSGADLIWHRRY